MGGQHGYFGLWVDADFGNGHSKAKPTCTTYSSPQLSAEENFRFEKMEVWAVGDPAASSPVSAAAEGSGRTLRGWRGAGSPFLVFPLGTGGWAGGELGTRACCASWECWASSRLPGSASTSAEALPTPACNSQRCRPGEQALGRAWTRRRVGFSQIGRHIARAAARPWGSGLLASAPHRHSLLLPKVKAKKSILDADPEAQALLEASGRTRHSEGLREAPDDTTSQ